MKHGILPRALLAAALLFAPLLARADVPVPPLRARVTDLTSTLSGDQVKTLESRLAALEAKKGSQVAVLLVPTIQPETVEQYAIRVFDQWKLGRKGVDDGVLLLVAKNDRRLRIEVGRGLEGAIPDAYAKRIIDEEIAPHFRQGDFYGGISAGVDRIAKLVDGEPMPLPPGRAERAERHDDSFWSGDHVWLAVIVAVVIAHMLQSVLGRLAGAGLAGIIAGGIAFVVAGIAMAVIAGIAVFILSLFSGLAGSGWSSGGYGGGGWSSGDSGGFSGGGGESGGGGASGSW